MLLTEFYKDRIYPATLLKADAEELAKSTGLILKHSSTRPGAIGVFAFDKNESPPIVRSFVLSKPELSKPDTAGEYPATTEALVRLIDFLKRDFNIDVVLPEELEQLRAAEVVPSASASTVAPREPMNPVVPNAAQIASRFRGEMRQIGLARESPKRVSNVVICSDFDGTATGIAGGDLVKIRPYTTLLDHPELHYNSPENRIKGDVQIVLNEQFGPYKEPFVCYQKPNSDMLMSKEAVAFYHAALASPHAELIIVTKNRADYVNALFKYHGFTDIEMAKLRIRPQLGATKEGTLLAETSDPVTGIKVGAETKVYVFDDNPADYASMRGAFESTGASIQGVQAATGTFKWGDYISYLKKDLTAAEEYQAPSITPSIAPH